MALFQQSVLCSYLKSIDMDSVARAYETYTRGFLPKITNIRTSKAEQYQYGFLDDLFVNVLALNPLFWIGKDTIGNNKYCCT